MSSGTTYYSRAKKALEKLKCPHRGQRDFKRTYSRIASSADDSLARALAKSLPLAVATFGHGIEACMADYLNVPNDRKDVVPQLRHLRPAGAHMRFAAPLTSVEIYVGKCPYPCVVQRSGSLN